jgi:hypothetical protein
MREGLAFRRRRARDAGDLLRGADARAGGGLRVAFPQPCAGGHSRDQRENEQERQGRKGERLDAPHHDARDARLEFLAVVAIGTVDGAHATSPSDAIIWPSRLSMYSAPRASSVR